MKLHAQTFHYSWLTLAVVALICKLLFDQEYAMRSKLAPASRRNQ